VAGDLSSVHKHVSLWQSRNEKGAAGNGALDEFSRKEVLNLVQRKVFTGFWAVRSHRAATSGLRGQHRGHRRVPTERGMKDLGRDELK
jgi:hypothetical protein